MKTTFGSTRITGLRCEYLCNPLGVATARPRLSWVLQARRRGARQTAYQVLAASARGGASDLWDSGRVKSDQSVQVAYAGRPLTARERAWWRVRVWDEQGRRTESSWAFWEMGLLAPSDWRADWIGGPAGGGHRTPAPAPFLRKAFVLEKTAARARLYATALGLYEFYLNRERVGADMFTPGWTDYSKQAQYQVYDVTTLVRRGANVAGAILGDGWYCGHVGVFGRQLWGDRPRLLAPLEVRFTDGSSVILASDRTWETAFGPIRESDLIMGECHDAQAELGDWASPGFDAARWRPVEVFTPPAIMLTATVGPCVRATQELVPVAEPRRIEQWPLPRWVFDLGQNMVGRARLKIRGPRGTTAQLRFAEVLNPDGTLYTDNLRQAQQTDTYVLKGGAEETWEPRFTFHGFRYVELSGVEGTPTKATVTGIVLHSGLESTGAFSCSDPLINQLQKNIVWGQRGNFVDVPTDCPQRDERLGWTGDAQVFVRTAAFNFDVAPFFTKWQRDLADAQSPAGAIPAVVPHIKLARHSCGPVSGDDGGPAWADAVVICPWTLHLCYGDTRLLEEHFNVFQRYIGYLEKTAFGLIRSHPEAEVMRGFGDWLALDGSGSLEGATPKDLIGTAFFAQAARLTARMARALGRPQAAARYDKLFTRVRAAFQRRFLTPAGLVAGLTQTGYVLALHFDLAPAALRPALVEHLVRDIEGRGGRLSTGFVGTSYLPHVLSDNGRLDVAYRLLHQTRWPSWLYAVTQGATTIWERWDGWTKEHGFQDKGMNSFNHYAYGAIGEWLYAVVAGIAPDPERPGYKHLLLRPRPGGKLTSARAALRSMYGEVASAWKLAGGRFRWEVAVPANTTATAWVPAARGSRVTEGNRPLGRAPGVRRLRRENGALVLELSAGKFRFEVERRSAPVAQQIRPRLPARPHPVRFGPEKRSSAGSLAR